jgi:hypothetical protein
MNFFFDKTDKVLLFIKIFNIIQDMSDQKNTICMGLNLSCVKTVANEKISHCLRISEF